MRFFTPNLNTIFGFVCLGGSTLAVAKFLQQEEEKRQREYKRLPVSKKIDLEVMRICRQTYFPWHDNSGHPLMQKLADDRCREGPLAARARVLFYAEAAKNIHRQEQKQECATTKTTPLNRNKLFRK